MLADDVVFNDVYFLVTKGVNPATVRECGPVTMLITCKSNQADVTHACTDQDASQVLHIICFFRSKPLQARFSSHAYAQTYVARLAPDV